MKLEVRNLKKTYGTVQALKGINYTFTPEYSPLDYPPQNIIKILTFL